MLGSSTKFAFDIDKEWIDTYNYGKSYHQRVPADDVPAIPVGTLGIFTTH